MNKDAIREAVWDALEGSGDARFPFPPHGRIPNFAGAERAGDRLAATPEWESAETIKANPDAPQLPVRRGALREGKRLYMAVPGLRDRECFFYCRTERLINSTDPRSGGDLSLPLSDSIELDPRRIDDPEAAPTVSHVEEYADRVAPDDLPEIDLIVSGSVAVDERGTRIGKGEGYSDLEFALLREVGAVADETTTATTIHEVQVREDLPRAPHDVPMDLLASPERVVRTGASGKPRGIRWEELSEERIEQIPALATFDGRGAYEDASPSRE